MCQVPIASILTTMDGGYESKELRVILLPFTISTSINVMSSASYLNKVYLLLVKDKYISQLPTATATGYTRSSILHIIY